MINWIKKIAFILGVATFFALLFISLVNCGEFTLSTIATAACFSLAGASVFWFIGIIIADVLFKGIITDIDTDSSALADGGLLQRVHTYKQMAVPGGAEMPYKIDQKTNGTPLE